MRRYLQRWGFLVPDQRRKVKKRTWVGNEPFPEKDIRLTAGDIPDRPVKPGA
jgi:hypothetical protein